MSRDAVRKLAEATLHLAVELRRELRLPEKLKAEKELEALIAYEDSLAAVARGVMGTGSEADVELAKKALGHFTKVK
jgi:hypothetical protein